MNAEEKDIRDFLIKAIEANPSMRFKCGKGACDDTYIVEVSGPEGCIDEEPYSRMEFDFTNMFEAEHPYYLVLFVPEGDSVGIVCPLFSVGYDDIPSYTYASPAFGVSCEDQDYYSDYCLLVA